MATVQCGRWTPVLVTAAMMVGWMGCWASGRDKGGDGEASGRTDVVRTISAERIVLVDAEGNNRIVLGVHEEKAVVAFMSPDGKPLGSVGVGRDGVVTTYFDRAGKRRMVWGTTADGAELLICEGDTRRAWLHDGGLALYDETNNPRVAVNNREGVVGFVVIDEKGTITWAAE